MSDTTAKYVNLNNTWTPCNVKVNTKSETFVYLNSSSAYDSEEAFIAYTQSNSNIPEYNPESNDIYYAGRPDPLMLLQDIGDINWGHDAQSSYEVSIYVKTISYEWKDCSIYSIE